MGDCHPEGGRTKDKSFDFFELIQSCKDNLATPGRVVGGNELDRRATYGVMVSQGRGVRANRFQSSLRGGEGGR
jgi:hypothetical protein